MDRAIPLATSWTKLRSAPPSFPWGVPTAMKTTRDFSTVPDRSVEKDSLPSAMLRRTISSRPGS